MSTLSNDAKRIHSLVGDTYQKTGKLLAVSDGAKLSRSNLQQTLEQVSSFMEKAVLELRRLCEIHSSGVCVFGKKPCTKAELPTGHIELAGCGWVHMQLNTLLPHCRYQAPEWLSETIRYMLVKYMTTTDFHLNFKQMVLVMVHNKFSTPTLEGAKRIVHASPRQLKSCHSTMRIEDDVVYFTNRGLAPNLLESITIMLELGGCAVFDFNAETSPILLRFVVDRPKLAAFAVVKNEHKPIPPHFYPAEKVIILLQPEDRPQPFPISNPQIFAMKLHDGSYLFMAPKSK